MSWRRNFARLRIQRYFAGRRPGLRLFLGFDAFESLPGFEADGFAGRDVDFFAGAGIAADTGLARLDAEDAKAAELDALAAAEGLLEGFENRFDSLLALVRLIESFGDNRIDDVQLNHTGLPLLWQMLEGAPQVVKTRWVNYTEFPLASCC